jgi:hypothetical protein
MVNRRRYFGGADHDDAVRSSCFTLDSLVLSDCINPLSAGNVIQLNSVITMALLCRHNIPDILSAGNGASFRYPKKSPGKRAREYVSDLDQSRLSVDGRGWQHVTTTALNHICLRQRSSV